MSTRAENVAALRASYAELVPGQKVEAGLFRPEDAPGVGRLFLQVYGDDYPVDEPYVPEMLTEANATGRIHTIIVRVPDGSIVGQGAIFRSSPPNTRMYEYGQMLVDKAYRNSFAAYRLHQYASKNMFGKLPGIDALYGEAVCHHIITQKMSVAVDFFECGLELGLMPEAAYAGEGVDGRVSCLLHIRLDDVGQGPLAIPACWREQIEATLPTWPLVRSVSVSGPEVAAPAGSVSDMDVRHFDFAGVTRVQVAAIGADFAQCVARDIAAAKQRDYAVVQFFVSLGQGWTGQAAETLRQAGGFFAGFFPQWFGTEGSGPDALLVQLYLKPIKLAPVMANAERGATVIRRVVADMLRAGREFGAPLASPLPDMDTLAKPGGKSSD
jgi:hypothetical protein